MMRDGSGAADVLVCGRPGVWTYWCVDAPVCGHTGVQTVVLSSTKGPATLHCFQEPLRSGRGQGMPTQHPFLGEQDTAQEGFSKQPARRAGPWQ